MKHITVLFTVITVLGALSFPGAQAQESKAMVSCTKTFDVNTGSMSYYGNCAETRGMWLYVPAEYRPATEMSVMWISPPKVMGITRESTLLVGHSFPTGRQLDCKAERYVQPPLDAFSKFDEPGFRLTCGFEHFIGKPRIVDGIWTVEWLGDKTNLELIARLVKRAEQR